MRSRAREEAPSRDAKPGGRQTHLLDSEDAAVVRVAVVRRAHDEALKADGERSPGLLLQRRRTGRRAVRWCRAEWSELRRDAVSRGKRLAWILSKCRFMPSIVSWREASSGAHSHERRGVPPPPETVGKKGRALSLEEKGPTHGLVCVRSRNITGRTVNRVVTGPRSAPFATLSLSISAAASADAFAACTIRRRKGAMRSGMRTKRIKGHSATDRPRLWRAQVLLSDRFCTSIDTGTLSALTIARRSAGDPSQSSSARGQTPNSTPESVMRSPPGMERNTLCHATWRHRREDVWRTVQV